MDVSCENAIAAWLVADRQTLIAPQHPLRIGEPAMAEPLRWPDILAVRPKHREVFPCEVTWSGSWTRHGRKISERRDHVDSIRASLEHWPGIGGEAWQVAVWHFGLPDHACLHGMVVEAKGGANVGIGVVRDLRGVLERETAKMAGPIIMDKPGNRKARNFAKEMAQAGDLNVMGMQHARMQILTVQEILDGERFKTPSVARAKGEFKPKLPLNESQPHA